MRSKSKDLGNSFLLDFAESYIHSFIHSFNKHLFKPSYVPITVLGVEDAAKDRQKSHSYRVDIPMGEVDNKH